MKQTARPSVLISAFTISLLLAAGTIALAPAAEKQTTTKGSPQNEFPFDQVGTVTKHGVDKCMVGINFELHSNVKAPLQKTTHWLVATSRTDIGVLGRASKDGSLVRIKGTMMINTEHCQWIAVSSATPVKKNKQSKRASCQPEAS